MILSKKPMAEKDDRKEMCANISRRKVSEEIQWSILGNFHQHCVVEENICHGL